MSWWRQLFPLPQPLPPQFTKPLRFGARVKVEEGFYGGVEGVVIATKRVEKYIGGSMVIPIEMFRVRLTVPCVGSETHIKHELSIEEWFERRQLAAL